MLREPAAGVRRSEHRVIAPEPVAHIVDDDPAIRRSLVVLITAHGAAVQAHDSAEAFLTETRGRTWRCLVTDLQLDGMSGLELLRRLRDQGCGAAVILMSAALTPQAAAAAAQLGATVVEKPFDPDQLLRRILAALDHGRGDGEPAEPV